MASPLQPGDRLEYGISIDLGSAWAKLSADVAVQEGETAADTWKRVTSVVERLLISHVDELKRALAA